MKKIDVAEHVNITKVVDMLSAKDKELAQLKNGEKNFEERVKRIKSKNMKEKEKMNRQIEQEVIMKQQIIEKVNTLKGEIKGFEVNDSQN